MSAITETTTQDAPQEHEGDMLSRLAQLSAEQGFAPADVEDGEPATAGTPQPPTPTPAAVAPAATEVAATAPAVDESDPIAVARREARAEADKEWQAKLAAEIKSVKDGHHGNVLSLQAQIAAEKARADTYDAKRDTEYQQLIDAATTAEERKYWVDQQALDKREREVTNKERAQEADAQVVQAVRQNNVQTAELGLRGAAIPALVDTITGYAAEKGLPVEEVQDLLANVQGQEVQWLLSQMPARDTPVWALKRSMDLQAAIDRRATAYQARTQTTDEDQAKANRQRDAQSGRFAANQQTTTGGSGRATETELISKYANTNDTLGMLKELYPRE